jgi:CDP-glucose 4,6-dehydratase
VATVRDLIEHARAAYGPGEVEYAESPQGPHEAGCLKLDIAKAEQTVGFKPKWELETAIARSIGWYREFAAGADAQKLCVEQIAEYESIA